MILTSFNNILRYDAYIVSSGSGCFVLIS